MDLRKFKQLYNYILEQIQEQKQQNSFIVQFTIQDVDFLFFKNQKNYLCKFGFNFLEEPQQITVQLKTDNKITFVMDDTNENQEEYSKDQFKEYFSYHYNLFVKAVNKFKEFITNKQKLKEEQNTLKVVPLEKLLNQTDNNDAANITIDNVVFNFEKIENSFKDILRVSFDITQNQDFPIQKHVIAVIKNLFSQNYFILKVFLSNMNKEDQDVNQNQEEVIQLTKDQFAQKYVIYFDKLNKAIKAYLNIH